MCIHMCVHVYIHSICIEVYMCVYVQYVHVNTDVYIMYMCMYIIYANVHVYIHTICIEVYMCVYVQHVHVNINVYSRKTALHFLKRALSLFTSAFAIRARIGLAKGFNLRFHLYIQGSRFQEKAPMCVCIYICRERKSEKKYPWEKAPKPWRARESALVLERKCSCTGQKNPEAARARERP